MAINYLGVPLIFLLIASVIGILIGIVLKHKRMLIISTAVLMAVVLIYIILFFIFH